MAKDSEIRESKTYVKCTAADDYGDEDIFNSRPSNYGKKCPYPDMLLEAAYKAKKPINGMIVIKNKFGHYELASS